MTNETLASLAPIIGAESLSDTPEGEQSLLAGVQALAQERDTAVRARTEAEQTLATERAKIDQVVEQRVRSATVKTHVDAALERAYRDGRLLHARNAETGAAMPSPRETRLRSIAERDGLEALQAELAEMPVLVPLGKRVVDGGQSGQLAAGNGGARTDLVVEHSAGETNPALASVAKQLGLDVKDLETSYRKLAGEDVDDAEAQ